MDKIKIVHQLNHSTSNYLVPSHIKILENPHTGETNIYWRQQYQQELNNVKRVQFVPQVYIPEN